VISVVDVMGDDLAVANAARVSFDKWKTTFEDKDAKLIHYLADHEHTTPFRHPHISLRCEAPIFLARQLGKHQVGLSWNEVSRRYVDDIPMYFTPQTWRARPENGIKQGSQGDFEDQQLCWDKYSDVVSVCNKAYYDLIKAGVAPEQVRMLLPQCMMTSWVWTGSLLAFFHVWRLRSEGHAQIEAQEFAKELDEVMTSLFPVSWEALKDAI
jgi:thymidylate synthase (FAD)